MTGKDIVGSAYAHIKRLRINFPAIAHQDLLTRRPHRHGDDLRPAIANTFKQRLTLVSSEIAVLAADDVYVPALTKLLFRLRQHFGLTADQKYRRSLSASARHQRFP